MIDPARAIAVHLAVDDLAVIQREIKRVIRFSRIMRMAAQRFFPGNPLALVFDQSLAGRDRFESKHAFAVHTRTAHGDPA
ncbi:hypothetical protein HDG33_005775 [Paraburkholderia sp. Cpub6]|nr:hypothetical protein [Paraburkholderia sp. Cpub6]